MIKKILIANRGEIACRVIRTARKLNINTVAVYSDADKDSLFVKQADESYHIGGSQPAESYLDINKIINIVKKSLIYMYFDKVRAEFRNEKLLMLQLLNHIFFVQKIV